MPKELFDFEDVLKKTRHRRYGVTLPQGGKRTVDEVVLTAVTNFNGAQVELSWVTPAYTYSADAYYQIFKNTQFLVAIPVGTNSYIDTAVGSGQEYTYRVTFYFS